MTGYDEARKKAAEVLHYWRKNHQLIIRDLGDKLEASLYLTMDDCEEFTGKIRRSKYFTDFGRDVFGDYAIFEFLYKP